MPFLGGASQRIDIKRKVVPSSERNFYFYIYSGRKLSAKADEPWVEGSSQLVHVDYTYWTLAYILSARGQLISWIGQKHTNSGPRLKPFCFDGRDL